MHMVVLHYTEDTFVAHARGEPRDWLQDAERMEEGLLRALWRAAFNCTRQDGACVRACVSSYLKCLLESMFCL
jgi:hypothetical protein